MKLSHGTCRCDGSTVAAATVAAQKQNRFSTKSPFGRRQRRSEENYIFYIEVAIFCSSFLCSLFSFSQNNVITDIFELSKTFVSGAEQSYSKNRFP